MRNKKFVSVMAVFLAALMLLGLVMTGIGGIRALAVTQYEIDRLEEQRKEISDKKKDLQEQIDALEMEIASVLERKEALDHQNELNRQNIELIDQQIELYDDMIEEKAQELEAAQEAEEYQYNRYRSRVRAMEENDAWSYVAVLFNARSFSDFLARLDDVYEILTYDKSLEEEYIAAREQVETVKAEYELVQEEQEAKKEELLEEKEKLEEQIEAAYTLMIELEKDVDAYTAAFEENELLENEIQAEIDKKTKELQDQKAREEAEKLAASSNKNNTITSGGSSNAGSNVTGYYYWPCQSSTYITSCFGYRVHPIFGTTKYHAGVDVAANSGATISAAAGGTVTIAEYSSSYGYYVVIYHSNGSTTLYAHMSSMAVSVGQTVSQGQTIGYVGSTGWSTGPHLHFEVRVNGSCVDPLQYFSNRFSYSADA